MIGNRKVCIPTPIFTLVIIALLAILAAACGDEATPTATGAPQATNTPTTAPTATAASVATATPTARPAATATATATRAPTSTPTAVPKVLVQPRLRVAVPAPAEQVTMPHPTSQVSEKLMPIYEHLIGKHPLTYAEGPQLAESWSVAADGRTWTWNLRQGIPFYNKEGRPTSFTFSAKDVVLTWDLLNGQEGSVKTTKARTPGVWHARLGGPELWEVAGTHKIVNHLPRVNLDMTYYFSDHWETGIVSKDHWDAVGGEDGYSANPIGNGPWTYIRHAINEGFLHKRVDNHWRKTPEFQELEIVLVKEDATQLAMLLAKEVDIIPLVRTNRATVEAAGMKTVKGPLPSVHMALGIIYYRPEAYCVDGKPPTGGSPCGPSKGHDVNDPMRNVTVRTALNHAVDRQTINQAFLQGTGFPLVDYFPPWRADWRDQWAPHPGPEGKTGAAGGWPYDYNPTKAKQLLTRAGYPNGFNTVLNCLRVHTVIPEWPDICEKLVQDFKAVGVTVKLEMEQAFGTFQRKAVARDRANWMWSSSPSWGSHPCENVTFSAIWELGNGYREFEEASEFYKKCGETRDIEVRNQLTREFGDVWYQNAFSIPLLHVFAEVAYNPNTVAEYRVHMAHMGPVRFHEFTKAMYK
ncbi:MAG: ABC transporter substrate-binding protein [SAR202 cluster bacterium]|nr:ABC transporter substrate-binding protein [SAR202 cluster bacterium]